MFSWSKRKSPRPEDTRAYQLGADMGQQMGDAIVAVMESRFKTVCDGYLNVLRDRLRLCFDGEEAPPIILARIEYKIFSENTCELKTKMPPEFELYLSECLRNADEIGIRADVYQLITQRVNDFSADLLLRGLDVLTNEYGGALISADAAWRARYPERSLQFPSE